MLYEKVVVILLTLLFSVHVFVLAEDTNKSLNETKNIDGDAVEYCKNSQRGSDNKYDRF